MLAWLLGLNKVLTMMIGELSYDEIFPGDKVERVIYWVLGNLLFFFFIVSVTILLQNLLLGWTINDMKVILFLVLILEVKMKIYAIV